MRSLARALAIVVLLAAVAAAWAAYALFADRSEPAQARQIIVARGTTFRGITEQLVRAQVIKHPTLFRLLAKAEHADRDVHAGEFQFPAHQTAAQTLFQLRSGGAQIAKWLTIPEGFTARQIAQRLQDEGFGPASTFASAFLHDSIVVGKTRTANMEGFLFPDTYLIPKGASPALVESILSAQLRKELPPNAAQKARALGLTVPQVITVASLVEREAKADDERALMAGVYYNRLRAGMPLQVDATLEYAFRHHHTVITGADLRRDTPYNSYLHTGLPPTPIANPGEPSIRAAFNPRPSKYLYYVYEGNGHHAFSRTLAQQERNIAKYLK